MKKFSMVVAATEKTMGIGLNGQIPWSLPKEMKYFQKTTLTVKDEKKRNAVIMGKKTWLSIPEKFRPLKNRLNIILSSTLQFESPVENTKIISSLQEALQHLETQEDVENVFIIGGSSLYAEAMKSPQCEKIYLTKVLADIKCDTFFPKIDTNQFFVDKEYHKDETEIENGIPYKYMLYKKKHEEYQYLDLLREVLTFGAIKDDRTGVGTLSLFGKQMKFDLRHSFPLLTTKRVFWKGVAEELIWFIQGNTNGKDLSEKGVKIWEGNGSREFLDSRGLKEREEGDLGPVYGFQWRHWGADYQTMHSDYSGKGIDQLQGCIDLIKKDPNSRRIVMSAWNPSDLSVMALPPCHMFCQFYVNNGELSCMMYQRSCDMGLGVPFNIASYALLTCMVAQVCGLKRGDFIHVLGDTHIYKNHVDPLKEQITRTPTDFPQLVIDNDTTDINKFKFEDFKIVGYKPQKTIKMEMAV